MSRQVNVLLQIIFLSLGSRPLIFTIYSFQKIVTVTFENVCRPAYETSRSVLNALEYNVYHRCLCYILEQLIVCVVVTLKQLTFRALAVPPFVRELQNAVQTREIDIYLSTEKQPFLNIYPESLFSLARILPSILTTS